MLVLAVRLTSGEYRERAIRPQKLPPKVNPIFLAHENECYHCVRSALMDMNSIIDNPFGTGHGDNVHNVMYAVVSTVFIR